jgi:hypothetical protein
MLPVVSFRPALMNDLSSGLTISVWVLAAGLE